MLVILVDLEENFWRGDRLHGDLGPCVANIWVSRVDGSEHVEKGLQLVDFTAANATTMRMEVLMMRQVRRVACHTSLRCNH